ncbi:hypothetical protein HOG47_07645 [archaeon]|jgi:hypothetical protein|nr:hypothetical protein [archaeon]
MAIEYKYYDHIIVLNAVQKMDFENMIIVYDLATEKYVSVKQSAKNKKINRHNVSVNLDDNRINYYSTKKTATEILEKLICKKFPDINYDKELKKVCENEIPSGYLVYDASTEETSFEDEEGMIYYNTCRLTKYFYEKQKNNKTLQDLYNELDNFPNFKILFKNLFNDNEEDTKYFLNWLASSFMGRKNLTSIIIKGVEGSGKGVLMKYIEWYFNSSNVLTASNEILRTDFNEQMENRMFVNLNEITLNKNRELYEKLKTWITDPTYNLNVKGVRQRTKANNMNFLITTNNAVPIEVSTTDRRYSIFLTKETNIKTIVNDTFFTDLEKEYIEFTKVLKSLKIDHTMADISIENDIKKAIAHNSTPKRDLLVRLIKENDYDKIEENIVIENSGDESKWQKFINDVELYNLIKTDISIWLYEKFVPGTATASTIGTHFGVHFGDTIQKTINGKKSRYRRITNTVGKVDKRTTKKQITSNDDMPF